MKCQNCGHNNQPNATSCARCGEALSEDFESTDLDSLYLPTDSPVNDGNKTAIYVAPVEGNAQIHPVISDT